MFWNALNDPMVGWLSDTSAGLTKRRIPAIKYGGPAWAVVFALAWYDWNANGEYGSVISGLRFTLILCMYDSLLTLVELNHGALLADLSVTVEDRTRLSTATAIGAVIGSTTSFFGHLYWNGGKGEGLAHFQRFRYYCNFSHPSHHNWSRPWREMGNTINPLIELLAEQCHCGPICSHRLQFFRVLCAIQSRREERSGAHGCPA